MTNKSILLKGRLDGAQRTRLKRLLDMLYKPSELADIVGFHKRQVYRVYLKLGLPGEKDKTGHLWINGKQFANWYLDNFKKIVLRNNEVFCLTCKQAVEVKKSRKVKKGKLVYLVCSCPNCKRKIAKIISNKRGLVDKQI